MRCSCEQLRLARLPALSSSSLRLCVVSPDPLWMPFLRSQDSAKQSASLAAMESASNRETRRDFPLHTAGKRSEASDFVCSGVSPSSAPASKMQLLSRTTRYSHHSRCSVIKPVASGCFSDGIAIARFVARVRFLPTESDCVVAAWDRSPPRARSVR